jgi:hypothetical protein
MHCNMGLLPARHWTRIWIKHIRQMSVELRRADTHIKDKIKNFEGRVPASKDPTGGANWRQ